MRTREEYQELLQRRRVIASLSGHVAVALINSLSLVNVPLETRRDVLEMIAHDADFVARMIVELSEVDK